MEIKSKHSIIIEIDGGIAAGKSTLTKYLCNNNAILNLKNARDVYRIPRLNRLLLLLLFVFKHPLFISVIIINTLRKRPKLLGNKLSNIRSACYKWAYATYMKGAHIVDEGFSKHADLKTFLNYYPSKHVNLLAIYVIADHEAIKNRIAERIKNNPETRQSHKSKLRKLDLKCNSNSNWLRKKAKITRKWQSKLNFSVPLFVFDTSPDADRESQVEALNSFLMKNIYS